MPSLLKMYLISVALSGSLAVWLFTSSQLITLSGVTILVRLILCDIALGLESVGKKNMVPLNRSSSSPSTCSPWSTVEQQRSCVYKSRYRQEGIGIFSRLIKRCNAQPRSGIRRRGRLLQPDRKARRQLRRLRDIPTRVTHAFEAAFPYAVKETCVCDGARCYLGEQRPTVIAAYRRRGKRHRGETNTAHSKSKGGRAHQATRDSPLLCCKPVSTQHARSHTVNVAKTPVLPNYGGDMLYTLLDHPLEGKVRASRYGASFIYGFPSSKLASSRSHIAEVNNLAGSASLCTGDYKCSSFLTCSLLHIRKATSLHVGGDTLEEVPNALRQQKGDVTTGSQGPSLNGETDDFLESAYPVETPPLPLTRTTQIHFNSNLLSLAGGAQASRTVFREVEESDHPQRQKPLEQQTGKMKATTKSYASLVGGLQGPLSMHDSRGCLTTAMNLEAPQDIYIVDFDNVIQLSQREIVNTAFGAWKRLEEEKNAASRSGSRWRTHLSGSSMTRSSVSDGLHTQGIGKSSAPESTSEPHPFPPVDSSSSCASDGRHFVEIFSQPRLALMKCPVWLEARMLDARRALAMRGIPDFMVAMRRIVELMMEVENERGCTVDSFVDRSETLFQNRWTKIGAAEKMWLVTKRGNFFDIRDIFKFRRGSADATGTGEDSAYPWIVRKLQAWENNGERETLYRRYNTSEAELQQAFDRTRTEWKKTNRKRWNECIRYRSSVTHVDPTDAERLTMYEGFNPAAIWCLNNHINNWRRPVHIFSTWETSAEVLSMLHLMGLSAADEEAGKLVHVYGRDIMEQLVAAEGNEPMKSQRAPTSTQEAPETKRWPLAPFILKEEEETTCLKRSAIRHILRGWRAGKDAWKPVHIVDGNVRSLLALRDSPELGEVRLYFCEWGPSTIEDKVIAFLASRIRYMKHSMQLVKLMSTPANLPVRMWTHGYTSCPPEWMEDYKVRQWLRWCGFVEGEETILQDISLHDRSTD